MSTRKSLCVVALRVMRALDGLPTSERFGVLALANTLVQVENVAAAQKQPALPEPEDE